MANGTIAASQLEMLSLSGTGIITITPPATNTNRAITLPDAAGALVVSGTTPSLNGITFPATQVSSADANTLDDYEEGTWTPTQGAGLTVIGAFTSSGTYTKVGRQVTVSGKLNGATTIACSAGGVFTAGLPFAPAIANASSATNSNLAGTVLYIDSTIYSVSAMSAAGSIYMTATYFV